MKILAIDYGKRKIGLAIADISSRLAEPHSVIRFKFLGEVFKKIGHVIQVEQIERIILGISEGKMAEETKKFGNKLKEEIKIPVVFYDETLSTQTAQKLAIEAGVRRKKRKAMEDAYSACLILQEYLDSRKIE